MVSRVCSLKPATNLLNAGIETHPPWSMPVPCGFSGHFVFFLRKRNDNLS